MVRFHMISPNDELVPTQEQAAGLLAIARNGNEHGAKRTVITFDPISGNICDITVADGYSPDQEIAGFSYDNYWTGK